MNIYTIYKVKNKINGKIYIGFTNDFKRRKKDHLTEATKKENNLSAFHKAIRKYGEHNFEWEIIYQSKDLYHTKNEMENYFILENNSFVGLTRSNGYNLTLGGDGSHGRECKEDTKEKMRKSMIEHYEIEENSKKHSDIMKKWWENLSQEKKKSISEGKINMTIVKDCVYGKIVGFVPTDHENIKNGMWVGINKGFAHSKETKENMSKTKKGKNPYERTEETNANISKGRKGKGLGEKNSMSNEENRRKVGLSKIGRKKYINYFTGNCKYCVPGTEPEGFVQIQKP